MVSFKFWFSELLCISVPGRAMPQHMWYRHTSAIGSTLQLGDLKISKKISDTKGAFMQRWAQ